LTYSTKISGRFWVKAVILLVGLLLVTSTVHAPAFAFAKGLTFSNPELNETGAVFPEVSGYNFKFLYRDVEYEHLAKQDASLLYGYLPLNASTPTIYVDVAIADTLNNLHNWEVCFVTWQVAQGQQPLVDVLDSRDIQIAENPPIIAHYFVFESPNNYTQVSLYWYEKALFNTGFTVEQKFVRLTLIILATDSTMYHIHEEEMFGFAQSIATYWGPLKEQSIFSLTIPVLQGLLVVTILIIGVSGTAEYTRKWQRKKKNQRIFQQFVPKDEKLLLQTIKKVNDESIATTENIVDALEQTTGERPEIDQLINTLHHLQENELIKIDMVRINDNPQLVWKTQS